jgi:hypothetical protein
LTLILLLLTSSLSRLVLRLCPRQATEQNEQRESKKPRCDSLGYHLNFVH